MNFIEIVDDTPPLWDKRKTYGELNTCKEIIDYFESVPNKSKGGLPFFNKSRQKVCVTKSFNFGDDNPINSSIYTFVNNSLYTIYKSMKKVKVSFLCTMNNLVLIPIGYLHGWFILMMQPQAQSFRIRK
jgi:hypothetical protein